MIISYNQKIINLISTGQDNISYQKSLEQINKKLVEEIGNETNGKSLDILYQDEETGETTVNLGVVKYDGEEMSFTLDIRYPKNGDAEVIDDKVINRINSYNFDVLEK